MIRRNLPRLVMLAVVLLLLFGVVTARMFVWPSTDAARGADAVVIFAGGRGERLAAAQRLMTAGLAGHLVIPNGTAPEWPAGNRACSDDLPYEVHCPQPEPDTTRGEARAIAALAAEKGWSRLIVVTSSYQLTRARMLLGRCFEGQVRAIRAQPHLSPLDWMRRVGHESLAWTHAMTFERSC
jgi:uncharacterized SAM-binding protein YcdF (DUF218 family)